jgi:hypothetical protein
MTLNQSWSVSATEAGAVLRSLASFKRKFRSENPPFLGESDAFAL